MTPSLVSVLAVIAILASTIVPTSSLPAAPAPAPSTGSIPNADAQNRNAVVSYDPGSGAAGRFTHPEAAVGWPSLTNPFGESTDPFNPPYGTNQIVSIGAGGHLTLGFQIPILNHPNNVAEFDFTVFGNAGFIITNEFSLETFDWIGTPATDGSLFGSSPITAVVSVSRNGRDFFPLNPALTPRLDGFAPTDSAGDPRLPMPAGATSTDAAGATLDTLRALYAGSAGGASFDLDWALDLQGTPRFLPEIRFIRIDVLQGRLEVDAIVPVSRTVRR